MTKQENDPVLVMDRLETWFAGCPAAAVALSGGVDSSLVAYAAHRVLGPEKATAYIADSPSLKRRDLALAIDFCKEHRISFELLDTQELGDPNYAENPANRCYFCKSTLYSALLEVLPADGSVWIVNGTNLDDLGDYRPGLRAGNEFAVRSPLAECGLDKAAIRDLALHMGLCCWDKPASPCLSSRIPYGQGVTAAKLERIESGETLLESMGFEITRVRHHENRAVVEVEPHRLAELEEKFPAIEAAFARLGFDYVEVDGEGFVSGKLNRSLGR